VPLPLVPAVRPALDVLLPLPLADAPDDDPDDEPDELADGLLELEDGLLELEDGLLELAEDEPAPLLIDAFVRMNDDPDADGDDDDDGEDDVEPLVPVAPASPRAMQPMTFTEPASLALELVRLVLEPV